MRNGVETLDLVVRMGDGPSLTLGAASIDSERMLLVGALIDREVPMQIGMTISVVATGELLEGAHSARPRSRSSSTVRRPASLGS
jgi:hypothetical protein